MSDKARAVLIGLINDTIPDSSMVGQVKAVDQSNYTCDVDPIDGSPTYFDVRLKATVDQTEDGIIQIPQIGSYVIISCLNNDKSVYYVSLFTTVIKWCLKVDGGASIEFDNAGNIKMNGGLLGGIAKINDLKIELIKLYTNINILLAATDAAITAHSTILDGGVTATAFNSAIAAMQVQDLTTLENTKVKHG